MKTYALPNITLRILAQNESEAKAVQQKINQLLGQAMTKMVFKGQGINLVGHDLPSDPVEE